MIFVGDRRPEQGHNAITHDLVDGAFIAMHRRHHAFEDRVEELAGLFGITIGQQLHRALEIGEQHRDLLAFAFEGSAGGEDLLGQMRWGVGQRCPVLSRVGGYGWRSGRHGSASPAQAAAGVIHHLGVRVEEVVSERLKLVVVQRELELEGSIGDPPATLQHGQGVVEDLLEGHGRSPPPRWRVPRQMGKSSRRPRDMDGQSSMSIPGARRSGTEIYPLAGAIPRLARESRRPATFCHLSAPPPEQLRSLTVFL
jgi:hypothetical protein